MGKRLTLKDIIIRSLGIKICPDCGCGKRKRATLNGFFFIVCFKCFKVLDPCKKENDRIRKVQNDCLSFTEIVKTQDEVSAEIEKRL